MARPSKKQQEWRRAVKREERRYARIERGFLMTPFHALADFAYVVCEDCGQEQSDRDVCMMCGGEIATTHPLHDEFRAELDRLRSTALDRLDVWLIPDASTDASPLPTVQRQRA